ncbi:hypothetical protein PIROE2DRAFT_17934 [Piromyces sp. E2]|nr:hypothetical protein PIROE2DRAFT_17934 [Piromyces sp. E2]|eukprot:OUM57158.1 hypothetical protein PIROE2DRAFT_17934 [Piromyces sp. E2]
MSLSTFIYKYRYILYIFQELLQTSNKSIMTLVIYNSLKAYSLLLSSKNIIVIAQLKAKIQFEINYQTT